ncbi:hypothetical protein JOF53_002559 [Crossiella equi]|uniref:Uncharacterized protein n=1 Tax=Crossiella equi TaxID=130796 RepID=A0ABS5ABM7_9PSEU|nr:hypothetical protein [Crossiella equi]MBP2473687.1 hypothetical protein [Crossiella equi]
MPEPVTLTVLALVKVLGGKAILAKAALLAVKSQGFAQGALLVAQMLVILGSAAAGLTAGEHARKALRAAGEGGFPKAVSPGRKALHAAGPVWKVWHPV